MARHIRDAGIVAKIFFSFIFPMFFWGVGLLIVYVGIAEYYLAKESTEWPIAEGEVLSSLVEEDESRRDGRTTYTYHARIRYDYRVDGRNYEGTRVSFGDSGSSDPSYAESVCAEYPVGKYVNVYYKPSDPTESVLEVGLTSKSYFLPIFGFIFLLIGIVIAIVIPISAFKKKP